jgi:hypothetical protein
LSSRAYPNQFIKFSTLSKICLFEWFETGLMAFLDGTHTYVSSLNYAKISQIPSDSDADLTYLLHVEIEKKNSLGQF